MLNIGSANTEVLSQVESGLALSEMEEIAGVPHT